MKAYGIALTEKERDFMYSLVWARLQEKRDDDPEFLNDLGHMCLRALRLGEMGEIEQ